MAFLSGVAGPISKAAQESKHSSWVILLAALGFLAAAAISPTGLVQIAFVSIGLTLMMSFVWVLALVKLARDSDARTAKILPQIIGDDTAPSVVTGPDGAIVYLNPAARNQLDAEGATTLAGVLRSTLANPGAILFRLETRAAAQGSAFEDVVTRAGHVMISVHRAGPERFLWRIEKSADRPLRDDAALPLPTFTLGRNDGVLFMNTAARDLIGGRVRTLDRICVSLPLRPGQMNMIHTKDGPVSCFAMELEGTAGRREIFLMPSDSEQANKGDRPSDDAVLDDLPVPLLKLARDGDILLSNRMARDLLGVEHCKGKSFGDLTEGLGRSISDWLGDAAAGRGTIQSETLRVKRDDSEVFIQVMLNRMSENGQPVLIAVLNDATKLKSLEEQFVQSQKMQAIGQLAGGVAHDFNNLLTAISGHCDLLLLRHDQGDADYADLMQINQNANRAAALVGQLLAYSRKQTLRPEVIDMRDTLSDLAHLLNRLVGEKVTLSLSHDPTLSATRADKRQLEQVIMNLVVNARDAMEKGGEIRIETQNLVLEEPLSRDRAVVAPGRYVSIKVIDQGEGIGPDKLQKVFEPFFTTKRVGEGTGLGLSTAYGIVKQTGGFIFVDSSLGEGACFQVLLPAHDVSADLDAPKPRVADTGAAMPQAEGVVLLVEDEAPVRAFASRALQLRGLTVLEAESAEDALELLSDPDLKVNVFVSDVVMPGIDGPSWVQEALKDRPDVRVVFMSGYAEETFGDTQAKIPNSVFLPKPFSLTELTETVQRQIA
ncbi:PAS domain-containing sensor histidine kinase [Roseovarius sp. 2305UL8-3]|uniref:PAS domain-containing sensor histidine kinase n=1 Tax=Roseovarius conchicola TaxID=3121636 RepID=UPI003528E98F